MLEEGIYVNKRGSRGPLFNGKITPFITTSFSTCIERFKKREHLSTGDTDGFSLLLPSKLIVWREE